MHQAAGKADDLAEGGWSRHPWGADVQGGQAPNLARTFKGKT